jgi:hypothetical protein
LYVLPELAYLGTRLDLLLNQKKYQQALWKVTDDILNLKKATDAQYQAADKLLVEAARIVLDFHWQKIKAEMLGDKPLKEPPYVRRLSACMTELIAPYCLARLQANVEPEWGPMKHPVCLYLRIASLQSDFAFAGAMPCTDF